MALVEGTTFLAEELLRVESVCFFIFWGLLGVGIFK